MSGADKPPLATVAATLARVLAEAREADGTVGRAAADHLAVLASSAETEARTLDAAVRAMTVIVEDAERALHRSRAEPEERERRIRALGSLSDARDGLARTQGTMVVMRAEAVAGAALWRQTQTKKNPRVGGPVLAFPPREEGQP